MKKPRKHWTTNKKDLGAMDVDSAEKDEEGDEDASSDDEDEGEDDPEPVKKKAKGETGDFIPLSRDGGRGRGRGDSRGGRGKIIL